jgi:hypothetical protein
VNDKKLIANEDNLNWNQSLLKQITNSSPLGFLLVDNRNDDIIYFNKRFCEIWGIEHLAEKMLNSKMKNNDIIPDCLPALIDIPAFAESCKPLQDEYNRIVITDEILFTNNRTIQRFSSQIRGDNDEYFGRLYIFEDITQKNNLIKEAEEANHNKSTFFSSMNHELRTPLNSILGYAQILQMGKLNPNQKKSVEHILSSGNQLLGLINEVLEISKIEEGYVYSKHEIVNVDGVISVVVDALRPAISNRKIKVEIISLENSPINIISDNKLITQVLFNLLNNAIKYNRTEGSIKIKTEIIKSFTDEFRKLKISITDTGIGVSADNLHKLFQPFERIGVEDLEIEGTGLGLSVVKKIIGVLSGKVGVESIDNVGSTFWVELPLQTNDHVKPKMMNYK